MPAGKPGGSGIPGGGIPGGKPAGGGGIPGGPPGGFIVDKLQKPPCSSQSNNEAGDKSI